MGGGYGGGGYGGGGYGMGGMGGGVIQLPNRPPITPPPASSAGTAPGATGTTTPGAASDRTGTYLGNQFPETGPGAGIGGSAVRIVPDIVNNVIIVQATQQDWELVHKTLAQLDVAPRQVLIDAKIYEVTLTGALSIGVHAFLQQQGTATGTRKLTGSADGGLLKLNIGTLIGNTRELISFLDLSSTQNKAKIISAPSVIATDNLPASINVGTSIPVLTSQGLAGGAQSGGTSLFTNTVSNMNTGVTLTITPRVNATGIVTLIINQEVSSPVPTTTSNINSPSIQQRTVNTQVTVDDGTTVAIGGIMQENHLYGAGRIPLIGRIPVLGAAFGNTSISDSKTELVILLTPHVIYDENDMKDMSEELRSRLRGLQKLLRND
jgi:general secretion pathway protein D